MITCRRLNKEDAQLVLDLYLTQPLYFQYCPPEPSLSSVLEDLEALPKHTDPKDKHFMGFFNQDELIAVLDLITSYPTSNTCWIGLFMRRNKEEYKGIGTVLIQALLDHLKKDGYTTVQLAYAKGNTQASSFWKKQGFLENGRINDCGLYTAIGMTKGLS